MPNNINSSITPILNDLKDGAINLKHAVSSVYNEVKISVSNTVVNMKDKIWSILQDSGNPSKNINGTSYDANIVYKSQDNSYLNKGNVKKFVDKISMEGPNSVEPIPVYVHEQKYPIIVDGYHRYEAFLNLGYDRIPIKYIHQNQISNYYRTLEDVLAGMHR